MRRGAGLALGAAAIGVAALVAWGGWWELDGRWRPHVITRGSARLAELVQSAGWVSPGRGGRPLYMISFRSCPDCIRLEKAQFPALQASGIDTRVIMVARRSKSTPAERSGVAALWSTGGWPLYERWTSMPVAAWTADGLPPADGDPARTALVEKGRTLVDALQPILAANGVSPQVHFPTLLWQDAQGRWRGCNCEDPRTYRALRRELGVEA